MPYGYQKFDYTTEPGSLQIRTSSNLPHDTHRPENHPMALPDEGSLTTYPSSRLTHHHGFHMRNEPWIHPSAHQNQNMVPYGYSQDFQQQWRTGFPQYMTTTTQPTSRLRAAIACTYCRRRKIRCSGIDKSPNGKCLNCVRYHQDCVFVLASSPTQVLVPAHTVATNPWEGGEECQSRPGSTVPQIQEHSNSPRTEMITGFPSVEAYKDYNRPSSAESLACFSNERNRPSLPGSMLTAPMRKPSPAQSINRKRPHIDTEHPMMSSLSAYRKSTGSAEHISKSRRVSMEYPHQQLITPTSITSASTEDQSPPPLVSSRTSLTGSFSSNFDAGSDADGLRDTELPLRDGMKEASREDRMSLSHILGL